MSGEDSMKKRALRKDFHREIKGTLNRFLSIFFIVTLGVAFYSGIQSSAPDMRISGDSYFDETNLMDIRVVGTLGLSENDIEALRQVEGVETVEPGYMTDALCGEGENQSVLHVEALLDTINRLAVAEGRLPEQSGECFLDKDYMDQFGYRVGDRIELILPDEEEETEEETKDGTEEEEEGQTLKTTAFTIVGSGYSSAYLSFTKGSSTLGTGEVDGLLYILPEDFDSEAYSVAYITVEGARDELTYTNGDDDLINTVLDRIEAIQDVRCQARYQEVVDEANETLEEYRQELSDGEQKLADAQQELADGKAEAESELESAKSELEEGESELESGKEELASSKTELEDARTQLSDGEAELAYQESQLNDARAQLQDGESQLAAAESELSQGQAEYNETAAAAGQQLKEGQAQIDAARTQLEEGQEQIDDARAQLEAGQTQIDQGQSELDAAAQASSEGAETLAQAQAEYDQGAQALAQAQAEYDAGAETLAQLQTQYDGGAAALTQAQTDYGARQTAYEASLQEYQTAAAEHEAGRAAAEEARGQIPGLQTQLDTARSTAAAARESAAALRQENGGLQSQIEEKNGQIGTLQGEVETLTGEIGALNERINQLNNELANPDLTEEQKGQLQGQINDLNGQVGEKTQLQGEKNGQIGTLQGEIAGLNGTIEANEATAQSKDGEAAAAEEQAGTLEGQIASLQSQVDSFDTQESQLSAQKGELDSTAQALAEEKTALDAQGQELAALAAQLEAGYASQSEGKAQLDAAYQKQSEGKAQLEAGYQQQSEAQAQIEAGRQELAERQAQLDAGQAELEEQQAQLDAGQAELEEKQQTIDQSQAQLESGAAQLQAGWNQINDSRQTLESSRAQVESGAAQLAEGWQTLEDSRQQLADGEEQIAQAESEIAENEQKIADGWKDYEEGRQEAQDQIAEGEQEIEDARAELKDAREQLEDAQAEIDDIEVPEWYVNNRNVLPEHAGFGENAERMTNIGRVFPVLFFLVAALISLTTMTRMVEEERTRIGTMKALGYSRGDIASKYLRYAFYATLGGGACGVLVGEKILPFIIVYAYEMMYHHLPRILVPYHWEYGLIAMGAALICTLGATFSSCWKELLVTPAELMRPPAPKEGKRIWLEYLPFLWRKMSFSWKSSVRNLFRYKKRFFMTVIGIGGCMGLLLVGFGLKDSIMGIADIQYGELQYYDQMITLDTGASSAEQEKVYAGLEEDDRIRSYRKVYAQSVSVMDGDKEYNPYLYVPQTARDLDQFMIFRDRITHETYSLNDEGAIITEKLATMLDLEAGDEIVIHDTDKGDLSVPITAIAENYLYHYIYMTPACYEKVYGEAPEYNTVLLNVTEEQQENNHDIGGDILALGGVLNVTYTDTISGQMNDMLGSLNIVVAVLIISAAMLAFVVLYNLNNININERKRELATIKVLGFYDLEVDFYVYRENIVLTFLGALAGIGIGVLLHRYIITTVEVELCMFGRNIYLPSYIYSVLFTFAFSFIINAAMHFKLKKIDMVESLKSVE